MKNKFFITTTFLILLATQFTNKCFAYAYDNPLAHGTLTSFIEGILTSIQDLVGILAVVFVVIGGLLYLTAGGKDSQITLAKNTIVYALIGFALAIAGPSLLKEIKDIAFNGNPTAVADAKPIVDILSDTLNFILSLFGILALLSFIFSGLSYLGSSGDKTRAEKAKKIALYSIIALSIAGGSIILVNQLISFL